MPKFDIPDHRTARADEVESASLRRWLPLLALAALLLFAAVCGALAWRQYQDAQRTDLKDARAKAVVAAAIFDSIFRGEIGTLDSMSQAPVVVSRDTTGMREYFLRVTKRNGQLFTGGLAWIDAQGKVRASSNVTSPGPVTDVSDRAYFREAVRTGKAFVSGGLTSRRTHRHVLVIAVPTRDAAGRTTGVLAGTLAREAHQARPEDDRPRLQRARHPRPRESARLLGLHAPAEPRVDQAIRQGAVRHPVRRARARRRLGPRGRVRAIERAPVERHPRPLALRDLRGRATQPRHRARADRGGDADRSRAAGLDPRTRPRRGPRAGRARSQPPPALRGGAPRRRDAPAQPAVRAPADPRRRFRGPLPGGQHGPRGRRRLVRRRAAARRDRAHQRRRRRGPGRRGSGADGTAAQRVPRVRLRQHLPGGDHVAPDPPHGRRRDGHSDLHHDRPGGAAPHLLLGGPSAAAAAR